MNALLSALSQLAQSALTVSVTVGIAQQKWAWFAQKRRLEDLELMDDATRGPERSLRLLLTLPLRYGSKVWECSSFFASIGAIIVLMMLTLQSFVQQAVQIE